MDINDLFNKELESLKPEDKGEELIKKFDSEFYAGDADTSREVEKAEISEKIKKLKIKLKKIKNVKNCRRTNINTENAIRRKKIKRDIAKLELDLQDIQTEEKGSEYRNADVQPTTE
jgi:hypothetical protein